MQKSFWQNSTPIYDKNSPESGHRGNLPHRNKGHTWQTHSKYQWLRTESISFKIRNKTRMSTLAIIIQYSLGSPNCVSHKKKKIKGIQIEKKKWNCRCLWMKWLYIENPEDATRKLELINEFSKIAGYKINKQKSLAFLYTNNERSDQKEKLRK